MNNMRKAPHNKSKVKAKIAKNKNKIKKVDKILNKKSKMKV